jgi:DNA-directed RNA polymerase subunit D
MKVKTAEFKENKGLLRLEDSNVYFVNALRRVMLSELPKLAIEDVIIYDNTSPLYDEIIAHRLGLIPIPTDLGLLTYRDECTCDGKGCPNCTVRYTLSKEGEGVVYSGDLQPEEESWKIKEDKIPIVTLSKDQRVILEVEAILGKGKDHAKWQTVIAPSYQLTTTLTLDEKHLDDAQEFFQTLPKGIVEMKGKTLTLSDPSQLPVLESYMDKAKVDFISIAKDPSKITYTYETDGSMNAKEALQQSIKILSEKYQELSKLLKKLK